MKRSRWSPVGIAGLTGEWLLRLRYSLGAIAVTLAAWQLVSKSGLGLVQSNVLPPFSSVIRALYNNHTTFLNQSWVTLDEALSGFLLSVVIGVPLGVFMALFKPLDRSLRPILVAGQVTPKIALAPIFLAVFGFGTEPKVVLAFLLGFFPVVLDTILGLRTVEPQKIYLARSCGAGWFTILARIRLPNALPMIMTGLKIAATLSITGAIVAEYISPGKGLGSTIVAAGAELKTDLLYAAILCLGILGFVMFAAISRIERLAVGWHPSQRSRALLRQR